VGTAKNENKNFGENVMATPFLSLNHSHVTLDPTKSLRLTQGTQQLLKERKTSIQLKIQTNAGGYDLDDNRVTLNHAELRIVL
jgi:hypothetical protein